MNEKTKKKLITMLGELDEKSTLPIWIRAPKGGEAEHYTQLTRGKLYQIERDGYVKTATLKQPGQVRGVKLFHLGSLLEYIERHANPTSNSN